MVGWLYHLPKKQARRRADELLERFDLVDAAIPAGKDVLGRHASPSRPLGEPRVLAARALPRRADKGLDPRSRIAMWGIIGELVSGGTTLLLTTQYLDEADRLADRIAVVDAGRVIAEGTSGELKARVGGERLEITVAQGEGLEDAARVLERYTHGDGGVRVDAERGYLVATVAGGAGLLAAVVRDLDTAGVRVDELGLHSPTLDDVFLTLTGHAAEPDATEDEGLLDEKEIA